eukprot:GHRR01018104.1.p1 GENE.GHRR01018104.1~~GHRR01018104.1.p1  ORF type:complete len:298 (+),score=133.00 GHRR01018104.1:663-1556(+)
MIAAVELAKLVNSAVESAKAAEGKDVAEQGRCLDILKVLQKSLVTAALLKETDAGKKINRLTKGNDSKIAAAAIQVVQAWKDCVKRLAMESAGGVGSMPSISSQLSLGTAASNGAADAALQQAANGSQQDGQSAQLNTPAPKRQQQQQQQQQLLPKPSQAAGATSRLPPKTGDPKRDKIRQLLCDGLSLVPVDQRAQQDPGEVAAEVEAAILQRFGATGPEYGAKVRSLSFNLKDASNPDLRARVVTGQIDPQQLVDMPAEELASDQKKNLNQKIRQEAAAEAVRGQAQQASTDMFK